MPYPRPDDAHAWGPPGARGGPWGPPWSRGDLDPDRRRRLRTAALTVPATALALVVLAGSSVANHFSHPPRALDALGYLLLLVAPACLPALGLGGRAAAVASVVAGAGVGAYLLLGYAFGPVVLPLVVVVVVLGASRRRVVSWTVAGLGVAAVVARGLADPTARPTSLVVWTTALLAAGLLGEGARGRGERMRAVQAVRVSREEAAATAERLRIARDLHDVLAHSLSAISVQAGVGLHLMDREPEQAREALRNIRATSVGALDEVREVLGILRADGEAPPREPAVTAAVDLVPGLLDAARTGGLVVDDRLDRAVLAGLDDDRASVLVRALQEALTNVRRHAGERPRVDARLVADAGVVRLEVVDDGGRAAASGGVGAGRASSSGRGSGSDVLSPGQPDGRPEGFGLRGMRERVEALGGTVGAGARGTGWAVVVELPRGAS
ncbi:sensor histidine kinase [Cellulomonas alba]|uniref:histidine kinase n=1 Tax=Cellulomonas alba TaxID=3053467 RepID=A0ABT7SKE6_9CELL|nr:histidine kinase [Cellulomonas alba]MDM7855989.1 histidine kinase [Cellulomonas alba]